MRPPLHLQIKMSAQIRKPGLTISNLISLNLGLAAGPVLAIKIALQLRIIETLEPNLLRLAKAGANSASSSTKSGDRDEGESVLAQELALAGAGALGQPPPPH